MAVANTVYGYQALFDKVTGNSNTAIGDLAGSAITHNWNIGIGKDVIGTSSESFVTRIGLATGGHAQTACYIGGIFGVNQAGTGSTAVFINNAGQLGTTASSERFKHDMNASPASIGVVPPLWRTTPLPEIT